MVNVSPETNDKLLKRVLPHGFMPSVPGSVVGVGLCASMPAAIICPLVVSGNAFDLSGFCGNPGVTRGLSVASISALSIKNREWLCLWDVNRSEAQVHSGEARVCGDQVSHQRLLL